MPALPPLSRSGRRKLVRAAQSPAVNSMPPGISTHGEASVRRDRAAVQSALDENASSAASKQLGKLMRLRSTVISNMERLIRRHREATDSAGAARTYRSQLERAGLGGELSPGMNPVVAAVLLTIFALIEMVAFHNALLLGFGLEDKDVLDKVEAWMFALLSVSVVFLGAHSGRHAKYAVQRLTLSRRLDRSHKPSLLSRFPWRRRKGEDASSAQAVPSTSGAPAAGDGSGIDPADRLPELDPRSEFTPKALRSEAGWDILHWIGAGTFAMGVIFASAELRRFGLAGNGLEQPAPMVFIMISSAVLMAAWVVEYSAANHWFKAVHGLDKQARKAERDLRAAERNEAKTTGKFDSIRVQLFSMLSVMGARAGYEGEIAEQIVHQGRGDAPYNAPWHPINRERVGLGYLPGLARLTPPYDPSDLSPDLLWQIAADRAQSPYADSFLRRRLRTADNDSGSLVEDIVPMQPTAQRLLWPSSMVVPDGWEPPAPIEVSPTVAVAAEAPLAEIPAPATPTSEYPTSEASVFEYPASEVPVFEAPAPESPYGGYVIDGADPHAAATMAPVVGPYYGGVEADAVTPATTEAVNPDVIDGHAGMVDPTLPQFTTEGFVVDQDPTESGEPMYYDPSIFARQAEADTMADAVSPVGSWAEGDTPGGPTASTGSDTAELTQPSDYPAVTARLAESGLERGNGQTGSRNPHAE